MWELRITYQHFSSWSICLILRCDTGPTTKTPIEATIKDIYKVSLLLWNERKWTHLSKKWNVFYTQPHPIVPNPFPFYSKLISSKPRVVSALKENILLVNRILMYFWKTSRLCKWQLRVRQKQRRQKTSNFRKLKITQWVAETSGRRKHKVYFVW